MKTSHILNLLGFICAVEAGPVIAAVAAAATRVGLQAVGSAILNAGVSSSVFGVGASGIWFGASTITNVGLYYGSAVVGVALTGGATVGGLAAGGVIGKDKDGNVKTVTDEASLSSIMSSYSESMRISAESKASAQAKTFSKLTVQMAQSKYQMNHPEIAESRSLRSETERLYSATIMSASASMASEYKATGTIPLPAGKPDATLPPDAPTAVPKGVPEYEYRVCQNDLAATGKSDQPLSFDNPSGYNLRIDNVPTSCMVLSTYMQPLPELGPHPVVVGTNSLEWQNVNHTFINNMRAAYGMGPVKD